MAGYGKKNIVDFEKYPEQETVFKGLELNNISRKVYKA